MKVAVTGANGFIGKNLCKYLASQHIDVTAIVRSKETANTIIRNQVTPIIADITDITSLKKAFQEIDIVFHLAALFNHAESSWQEYQQINETGTANVLNVALSQGVSRVVHCSTIGVASSDGNVPYSEKSPYAFPKWDKYETTKCNAEKIALKFCQHNSLEVVIIRPAQVYGPGDRSKAKFYRMVQKGIIVNPGNTSKHPIYVDDLCKAFFLAAKAKGVNGEIFIAGNRHPILLSELIHIVARTLQVPYPRLTIPAIPITILCTITETVCNFFHIKPILFRRSMDFFTKNVGFDVSKAKKVLNFESNTSIEQGIRKTAEWYKSVGLL